MKVMVFVKATQASENATPPDPKMMEDRKSTRLNSSHVD